MIILTDICYENNPISVESVSHKRAEIIAGLWGNRKGLPSDLQIDVNNLKQSFISCSRHFTIYISHWALLLMVLPPTIISLPGTSSHLGSAGGCGCPDQLWCQHHGSQIYVLKIQPH